LTRDCALQAALARRARVGIEDFSAVIGVKPHALRMVDLDRVVRPRMNIVSCDMIEFYAPTERRAAW
jgi:hypothetical protein